MIRTPTGEMLRDLIYGDRLPENPLNPLRKRRKLSLYTVLFLLLKEKVQMSRTRWLRVMNGAYALFHAIVLAPV